MKRIAIIGAGGFGREVHSLIQDINKVNKEYEFIGYFDDGVEKGKIINGFPVLGKVEDINQINDETYIAVAIGNSTIKKDVIERIHNKSIVFPNLIHPNVLIGDANYNKIGKGCIICAGVIITVNIVIEDFVILNLSCTVGHDTTIGAYSSFMPTVNISGEVIIGKQVYVGTGAKIINQLEIGEKSIIGSGAVVTKSLPANCTAVGVPAKPIKFHVKEDTLKGAGEADGGGNTLICCTLPFGVKYSPALSWAS